MKNIDKSIVIDNITISYQRHPVVHHVSVAFPKCETVAIIGPNGAGKSTLLKAIMDFIHYDEGHITYHVDRREIAYLPQQSEINRELPITVEDLVAMGFLSKVGAFKKVSLDQYQKIHAAIDYVGLSGFEKRSIGALSNGQFQRALFARIIVQESDLIILDEPFNAVDAKTVVDLCALINQWVYEEKKSVIAVIHDFHLAKTYFNYTLLMARELIGFGKTKDVLCEHNIEKAYSSLLHWDENAEICEKEHAS